MRKYIFAIVLFLAMGIQVNAQCPIHGTCPSTVKPPFFTVPQSNCNKIYSHRNVMYNALNLTDEQKACKREIDKNKRAELSEVLPELYEAEGKLKILENGACSKKELRAQQRVVNDLQKRVEQIDEKYQKQFKSQLTSLQKSKYHNLQRLQKRGLKKCQKCECRKLPKGMKPFAPRYTAVENCGCGKTNCDCK